MAGEDAAAVSAEKLDGGLSGGEIAGGGKGDDHGLRRRRRLRAEGGEGFVRLRFGSDEGGDGSFIGC